MRFLITRTDNIGDVILSLALPHLLKKNFGRHIEICYLARNYTKAVIDACPYIDEFISEDYLLSLSEEDAIEYMKSLNIDVFIPLYEARYPAYLAYKAKIKKRLGHARRSYFLRYCNKIVWPFKRKRCELHQAQMSLQYLKGFKLPWNYSRKEISELIEIHPKAHASVDQLLTPGIFHLVIHPGNNGHTISWAKESFAKLISMIPHNIRVYISGSTKEKELFGDLLQLHPNTVDLFGTMPLEEYLYFLSKVNGIVVSATGPLHIAAALNTPCIGLYPDYRDLDIKRWGALSDYAINMVAPSCQHVRSKVRCPDLHMISPEMVLKTMQDNWTLP